ncbi:MAG: ORF6N domain-containing protein [Nitrospirae bacterium]|nr:ORF6N domain-containing protein [Nitrospirota bacterium]
MRSLVAAKLIEEKIVMLRGHKVILDRDLAVLYGVTTANLNKAINRNKNRFPDDFMFQLTDDEFKNLMFHFGISSWGGTRKLPYVFTEQGVAMLSGILRSKRAIQVDIEIMRTFVRLRQMIATHKELSGKLDALERKYDAQFKVVFDAIRELMASPKANPKRIGFYVKERAMRYGAARPVGSA